MTLVLTGLAVGLVVGFNFGLMVAAALSARRTQGLVGAAGRPRAHGPCRLTRAISPARHRQHRGD